MRINGIDTSNDSWHEISFYTKSPPLISGGWYKGDDGKEVP